jgi:hypothetical protein
MIKKIWGLISNWKKEREFQKRLKELQKRDPFIYK